MLLFIRRDSITRYLCYNDPIEHPVVIQFRGSDPERMAKATELAASAGYDAVNINCGCPAHKNKGEEMFGAVLMKEPLKVQEMAKAMVKASSIPVTVKCRIGVDELDSYDSLRHFILTVSKGGVNHFIIHARKALLNGLNHIENRIVPPLKYDWAYALAKDFPGIRFDLNGGLQNIESVNIVYFM